MNWNQGLIKFLVDIRSNNYDKEFASFHATNLMMQEGVINYDISLDDNITPLILDFFVKLDADPVDQSTFRRIIDDLIEVFSGRDDQGDTQILFVLYKEQIKQLYKRYTENRISIESLRSSLRRYCSQKDDFNKLIDLVKTS